MANVLGYVPKPEELEKARAKNCFTLIVNGNYDNAIYKKWDTFTTKKAIPLSNILGIRRSEARDSYAAISHWVKFATPMDAILAYAKANPSANIQIFI